MFEGYVEWSALFPLIDFLKGRAINFFLVDVEY
jgi:hypothetical protein